MKQAVIPVLVLLLVTSFGFNLFQAQKNGERLTVSQIIDGDTFLLSSGERVRLIGIDASEENRCGYTEAKDLLSNLISGKTVRITEEKRDNYGRRMGLVYEGKTLVNEHMLRAGWARPDYTKNSQSERLRQAANDASANDRGLYSACKQTNSDPPEAGCVIKGNIDRGTGEHYFHLPTCRHYKQTVMNLDIGDQWFCSASEASHAGFRLAPDCLR